MSSTLRLGVRVYFFFPKLLRLGTTCLVWARSCFVCVKHPSSGRSGILFFPQVASSGKVLRLRQTSASSGCMGAWVHVWVHVFTFSRFRVAIFHFFTFSRFHVFIEVLRLRQTSASSGCMGVWVHVWVHVFTFSRFRVSLFHFFTFSRFHVFIFFHGCFVCV